MLAVDDECVVATEQSNITATNGSDSSCEHSKTNHTCSYPRACLHISSMSLLKLYVESGNGSVRVLEIECGTLEEGSAPESVGEQLKQFEERFVLHICRNQSFEGASLPLSGCGWSASCSHPKLALQGTKYSVWLKKNIEQRKKCGKIF